MFTFLTVVRMLGIALLFLNLLYILGQRPSRAQPHLILLVIAMIVMLVGYHIEINAVTESSAMLGASFSYLGKPFALLAATLFIVNYCGFEVKRPVVVVLFLFNGLIPLSVFTNSYHHLYYATVALDLSKKYSPLVLTHGPLYILNMINIGGSFAISLFCLVREFIICKNSLIRRQLSYLFATLLCSVVGYLFYILGLTNGYDSTMTGTVVGSFFLTILFYRYRLFDSLTLAKDRALEEGLSGILVLTPEGRISYSNALVKSLLSSSLTLEEVHGIPDGKSVLRRGDKVYEVRKSGVIDRGRNFGKIMDFTDITEKYNYSAKLEEEVESRKKQIHAVQRSIIVSLAGLVEARDSSTGEHVTRMQKYVEMIAAELYKEGKFPDELSAEYCDILTEVSPLHDIGKIVIPDSILLKPARLTPEEFEIIKTHTTEGERVIRECLEGVERPVYVAMATDVARYHHEKWDGSGYPEHRKGEEIPLCARIAAVADVYDAIRSRRCYKAPMDVLEARQVIVDGVGTHFDPIVAEAFFRILPELEAIR